MAQPLKHFGDNAGQAIASFGKNATFDFESLPCARFRAGAPGV
jgi:hypothetical protein